MAEAKLVNVKIFGIFFFFFLMFLKKKKGIHDNAMGIFFFLLFCKLRNSEIFYEWVSTPKYKST